MDAETRRSLIAKIHIGKAQIGLDEDAYRAMLKRVAGVASSASASEAGLVAVVNELKRLGFMDQGGFRKSGRAEVRLIFALWGELKKQGKLSSPTPAALRAFCANQTGAAGASKDPEHMTAAECRQVAEALKAWVNRPSKEAS